MIKTITRENSKLHGDIGSRETRRYQVIKEYPRYYLCECIYNGKSVYIGTRNNNKPRMTGYPLLMTEKKNQIVALTHDEINKVLASMPDDE